MDSNDIIEAKDYNVAINGSLTLGSINASAEALGTLYYYNNHFYGKTSSGVKQLDNTTSLALRESDETSEAIQMLMEENESLKKELNTIKKHLQELDKKVLSQNTE